MNEIIRIILGGLAFLMFAGGFAFIMMLVFDYNYSIRLRRETITPENPASKDPGPESKKDYVACHECGVHLDTWKAKKVDSYNYNSSSFGVWGLGVGTGKIELYYCQSHAPAYDTVARINDSISYTANLQVDKNGTPIKKGKTK